MKSWTSGLIGFIAGIISAGIVCIIISYNKQGSNAVQVGPAEELAGKKPTVKECQRVVTYKGNEGALGVPSATGREIVAAMYLPAEEFPRTVSATHTEGTGVIELFVRNDPLPLVGFTSSYRLGVAYGVRTGASSAVGRLYGSAELFQLKMLRFGVQGDIDTTGSAFAGAYTERTWK